MGQSGIETPHGAGDTFAGDEASEGTARDTPAGDDGEGAADGDEEMPDGRDGEAVSRAPERGLGGALALTVASALVWGIAHLRAGRRIAGLLLMGLFVVLVGGAAAVALDFRGDLKQIALRRDWLTGITAGILVLALVWASVVVRSYQVVRPSGLGRAARIIAGGLVVVLAVGVCSPLVWAARDTYTWRDTIHTIFHGDAARPHPVDAADPWEGRSRVNVLLLGGDGAGDRIGVRTDSMTVASIDTRTGDTVLISLPRNLQRFPVIPRLRSRWPDGFTGVGAPGDVGLLNELYQDAEDDPSLVPGFGKGRRGAELLREEISYLIDQPIDYYVLVNLFGFADIVDAIGGVRVHIEHDIPYGGPEDGSAPTGVLKAGDRLLDGKEALWYGRSRTASSDFDRMARQKCLMKAIADQADPQKVLTGFQRLAAAAKKAISTNIPEELLPAFVALSDKVKHGAEITSLMFVPPHFHVYRPDVRTMRRLTAKAIADSEEHGRTASPGASADASAVPGTPTNAQVTPGAPANGPVTPEASPGDPATPDASSGASSTPEPDDSPDGGASQSTARAVSLAAACG